MGVDGDGARLAAVSAGDAAGRLFRVYERHCRTPGLDTLFELLNAMHSLNDRLKATTQRDLHAVQEFVALKALRNFAHHREEVRANVRVIPAPAISDLGSLCIVRRDQVERAIESTPERWQADTRAACETRFHWYGQAVNINPCIFNFMVRAYEMLVELGVQTSQDAVGSFQASYRREEEEGHSHYVSGLLTTNVAEISATLSAVAAELPSV